MKKTVRAVADELGVWEMLAAGVSARLAAKRAEALLDRLGSMPVRASHAVGLLGSYAHRGAEPLHIRLQMRQEPALLRVTLLHELAHACDHLASADPRRHRCTHGPGWRQWAAVFGIAPQRSGHSPALAELRQTRLKPVAICERCGQVFHRLRRLSPRRSWVHPECGNGRVVALPARERGLP